MMRGGIYGWAYNQQQQPIQPNAPCRTFAKISSFPQGHSQLAVSLLSQKRFGEAIDVLQAALDFKPTWRDCTTIWLCLCATRPNNDAVSHLRNALERDPNYVPTYLALAELLTGRGEKREARQLLSQALDLSPSDVRARALLKQTEQP